MYYNIEITLQKYRPLTHVIIIMIAGNCEMGRARSVNVKYNLESGFY